MKKKDIQQVMKMSAGELVKTLADKRDALRNFRFAMSGGKAKNVREGRELRKDIARVLTAIGQGK